VEENPGMQVEFYLIDPVEVLHFAPVVRALVGMGVDAYFVLRRGDTSTVQLGLYSTDADVAETLIKRLQLHFAPFPNPNADIALTIHNGRILRDYRKLRARMMYGVGLVSPEYYSSGMSVGFDLYLVHGEFSRQPSMQFLHHTVPSAPLPPGQVRTIGYPRFDAWFNNPPNAQLIRAKYEMNPHKPAILYLPTWQYRSSVDTFADAIFTLSERFEIFVKPHHCTYRLEPERIRNLSSGPVRMLESTTPPEEAFAVADIVISDVSSGALTEAILLNKKVVCLARRDEVEHLLLPEIKQHIAICGAPEKLSQSISEALTLGTRSQQIQKLRRYMFDTTEGDDAVRAARAIIEFTDQRPRRLWSTMRTDLRWRGQCLGEMARGALPEGIKRPARALRDRLRRRKSCKNLACLLRRLRSSLVSRKISRREDISKRSTCDSGR
jgi:CDP-Glycerol:Poly(glycerophosphate) glycerophosphotransferase